MDIPENYHDEQLSAYPQPDQPEKKDYTPPEVEYYGDLNRITGDEIGASE